MKNILTAVGIFLSFILLLSFAKYREAWTSSTGNKSDTTYRPIPDTGSFPVRTSFYNYNFGPLYRSFPGTDSLRAYNAQWITNNSSQAFTNYRLNTLLAGMIDWIDSARLGLGGQPGVDSIAAINDSTFRYRKNGTFHNVVIRGNFSANNYTTGTSFNTGTGILTTTRSGLSSLTVDIDGRYVNTILRRKDSVFYAKDGVETFAFKDSTGGVGTVTSVSGTTDRIFVTNGTTTPVINIDPAYAGQTSITTLGVVTTGSWLGSTIQGGYGGTAQSTTTPGDLLIGSGTNSWSKLADAATGNALISGGVGVAPSYGKIGLTTHISGILPIANGGTNASTANAGLNNLLPTQTGNSGKALVTDGTNASWTTVSGGSGGINQVIQGNALGGVVTRRTNDTVIVESGNTDAVDLVHKFKKRKQRKKLFDLTNGINEFDLIKVNDTFHLFYTVGSDCILKKAKTLAALEAATPVTIITNCQYPGAQYYGGLFHVWGWNFSALKSIHYTSTTATGTYTNRDTLPLNKADVQIRQNPATGYWYTGYKDLSIDEKPAGILRAPTPFGPWTDLGYVFPLNARAYTHFYEEADPFVFFKGKQAYLAYAGLELDAQNAPWQSIQMVRLDSNYKAQGQETILVYPQEAWQTATAKKVFNPVFYEDENGQKLFYAKNNGGSSGGWSYIEVIEDQYHVGGLNLNLTALVDDYSGRPMKMYGAYGKVANGIQLTSSTGGCWGFNGFDTLTTGDFTMVVEFTASTLDSVQKRIFGLSTTSDAYNIGLFISSTNHLAYLCETGAGPTPINLGSDTLSKNTYYQVVMRRYDGLLTIILNKDTLLNTSNTADFSHNLKIYRLGNDSGYAQSPGGQFIGYINKAEFVTYARQFSDLNLSNNVTPGVVSGGSGGGLSSVIADAPILGTGVSADHLRLDTSAGPTKVATQYYVSTHGSGWLTGSPNSITGTGSFGTFNNNNIAIYSNNTLAGMITKTGALIWGDSTDDGSGAKVQIHNVGLNIVNGSTTTGNFTDYVGTSAVNVGVIRRGGLQWYHNYGVHNQYSGVSAGNFTQTGTENTGTGYAALSALTTGSNNTAGGSQVAGGWTTANRNTAFGYAGLYDNTTQGGSTAVGAEAGRGAGNTNSDFFGDGTKSAGTALTNSSLWGHGITSNLSNISAICRGDQNFLIGFTTPATNTTGYRLQLNGSALISDSLKLGFARTGLATDSVVVRGTDGVLRAVAQSSIGAGTTIYNGDGTLSGARTVTGAANDLTFTGVGDYNLYSSTFTFAKTNGTAKYTGLVNGINANTWSLGYLKGSAISSGINIDTNNNVIVGPNFSSSLPLYATGGALYVTGVQSGAGNFFRVHNVSANTTLDLTDYFIRVDATSGNVTITLPAASTAFGANVGIQYIVKKIDASGNTVTITRAGSDTIDGANTSVISAQWDIKRVICSSSTTWSLF